MTNLEKAGPEIAEQAIMWAGCIRARLELHGWEARVWTAYGRCRVYVKTAMGGVEIRVYSGCLEIHGNGWPPIADQVRQVLGDLLYQAPFPD